MLIIRKSELLFKSDSIATIMTIKEIISKEAIIRGNQINTNVGMYLIVIS